MQHRRVALHVSPHPDDEAIAAAMTLGGLARNGWQVVNLLLSLGRPADESRRRAEAAAAAQAAGYALEISIASDEASCLSVIATALERHRPELVISPQPNDGHPAHERVGRAVRRTLEASSDPPVWWMWGLWAELADPTLYLAFGEDDLDRALGVLEAYPGELARNDFRRVVRGRATANTVLGSERVFGFGSAAASEAPYAELLTETNWRDGRWHVGRPRMVDLANPFAS